MQVALAFPRRDRQSKLTTISYEKKLHSQKKKTCSGRMAGKEKENMKRKGKQRLVGEMAIRWIAIVHFCKFSCWRFFFFST
jgi:putative NADPH-quinone reductase